MTGAEIADAIAEARREERARCLAIARGCTDYLGGYVHPGDEDKLDAFHHGIETVCNALRARPDDYQTRAVEGIGRRALAEDLVDELEAEIARRRGDL